MKTNKLITNLIYLSTTVTMLAGCSCALFTVHGLVNDYNIILSLSFMIAFYLLSFLNIFALITSK